ncbi:MAG TPA: putative lipid II flippase FtsW [Candidatus Wildermuthbacteria bacterium]|nr:putative lipid II flippase FtsW [Candidatus Wildermuthbacteria bacterium]
MQKKTHSPDSILLGLCVALLFAGIFILASVSAAFSLQKTGSTFFFLNHQILFGLIPGLFLAGIAYFTPIAFIKKWSVVGLLLAIITLGLVFIPEIGGKLGGAARWITLGPITFQPSEFLKIGFILYLASWLSARTQKQPALRKQSWFSESGQTLLIFGIIISVLGIFLILQPDIGTLGVIGIISIIMYFSASTPLWHTIFLAGSGVAALIVLIQLAPYRLSRVAVFLDPSLDPLGKGYQLKQALIGIGSGGIFGVGLGLSLQKFGILPEPISDSVFAVFAEEAGFIGAVLLILLFLAFAWRSIVIAKRIKDPFGKLVIIGIASWITIQAFVNIGSMLGLLPLTGIPLPFISYGGSALVAELIGLGVLLNISRRTG